MFMAGIYYPHFLLVVNENILERKDAQRNKLKRLHSTHGLVKRKREAWKNEPEAPE